MAEKMEMCPPYITENMRETLWKSEEGKYEETGVRPSRKDLWVMTHTRKDGTPVDASGEVIAKIKEYEEAHPESMSSHIRSNDILSKILDLDRRGCVRGLAFGATPSNIFGSSSSRSTQSWQEVIV